MSRKDNEKTINSYITIIWSTCERKTGGGLLNLQEIVASSNKPDSEPPLTDRTLRLAMHPDNKHAARRIEPAVSWLGENNGVAHYAVRQVISDPTLPGKWETDLSPDGHDPARLSAYWGGIRLVAERIEERESGVKLAIAYDPEDEPAANKSEAHQRRRRHGVEEAYEDLAKLVHRRMDAGEGKTEAVAAVAHNNDTSPSKVWRALAFAKGHQKEKA